MMNREEWARELARAEFKVVHSDNEGNEVFQEIDGEYYIDLFSRNVGGRAFSIRCVGNTKAECIEDLIFKIRDYLPMSEDKLYGGYVAHITNQYDTCLNCNNNLSEENKLMGESWCCIECEQEWYEKCIEREQEGHEKNEKSKA